MQLLCILGRQPALGLAELESRFGADAVNLISRDIAMLKIDTMPNFNYLGSVLKVAQVWETLDTNDWNEITSYLTKELPGDWQMSVGGKLTLGLSAYNFRIKPDQINATALSLKKELRKQTCITSVRVVPNKENELNTAQVLHNDLTGKKGLELIAVQNGDRTFIAQTNWVQDIESYADRDQNSPARDARVGMLPPKLAQIIISLSLNTQTSLKNNETEITTVLDPFCGTGVILQESLLQYIRAYGTDLEPRMVEYSQKNLEWLQAPPDKYRLEVGDATNHQWQKPYDTIACETYLGRPFNQEPDKETLTKVVHDVNIIHKKFLQNAASQTKQGFRMCIAVPAWHIKGQIKHLPVLDHLEELGYNRVKFVHASQAELIYHRPGQVVGRELVILIRK